MNAGSGGRLGGGAGGPASADDAALTSDAKAIFDAATDAIFVVTAEVFVYANPRTLEMFRCTERDIVGSAPHVFSPLTQPGGRPSAELAHERMTAAFEARSQVFEWRHRRRDGEEFDAEVSLSRIEWAGEPHLFAIVREISDRKRAEAALRESEERLRKIFEQSPMAMAIVGLDGTIEQINRKAIEVFGYLPEDIPTMAEWWALAYPDPVYREAVMATWMGLVGEALANGREIEGRRYRVACKDGSIKTTEILGVPVAEKIFVMFGDVTEQALAEQRLRDDNAELEARVRARTAELERANDELTSFAYSASHELRAPLARMEGFCREIQASIAAGDLAELPRFASRIAASGARMKSVIDSLLLLTRLSRADLVREPFDLSAMAAEVLERQLERAGVRTARVHIAPGLRAHGDRRMWEIVLENLLGNAVKYSAKRPVPEIEVGVAEPGERPVYVVRDNGAGFDMAFAAKLFQPFRRLHGDAEFEGTGVGLAIAHRIVERHGGRLWGEGAPQRGAAFYFTTSE